MMNTEENALSALQKILDSVATLMLFALVAFCVAFWFGPWYILTALLPAFLTLILLVIGNALRIERARISRAAEKVEDEETRKVSYNAEMLTVAELAAQKKIKDNVTNLRNQLIRNDEIKEIRGKDYND